MSCKSRTTTTEAPEELEEAIVQMTLSSPRPRRRHTSRDGSLAGWKREGFPPSQPPPPNVRPQSLPGNRKATAGRNGGLQEKEAELFPTLAQTPTSNTQPKFHQVGNGKHTISSLLLSVLACFVCYVS